MDVWIAQMSYSLQFLTACTKDMHTPICWTCVNKSKKFRQHGFTHGCRAVVTVTVSYYDSDKRTLMRGNRREKIRLERYHKKRTARIQSRAERNICVMAIVIFSLCKWDMLSKAILDWRKWEELRAMISYFAETMICPRPFFCVLSKADQTKLAIDYCF